MSYPDLLTTRQSQNISKPLVLCFLDMKRLHQLGLHVQSLCHRLTSNGLAQSNDRTGESQCHWCCHGRLLLVQFYGGRTHCLSLWPLGTNVQKTAAEYCTNSLAATECGTSWSSIQWTTLLLCFVGVICSFQGERGFMSLPCKGESFCMYNILHFCAKEFLDFTI